MLTAAAGSLLASAVAGTIVSTWDLSSSPANPNPLTGLAYGLLGTQLLWGALGITAFILGIVAVQRPAGRRHGLTAIIGAIVAPLLSLLLFFTVAFIIGWTR